MDAAGMASCGAAETGGMAGDRSAGGALFRRCVRGVAVVPRRAGDRAGDGEIVINARDAGGAVGGGDDRSGGSAASRRNGFAGSAWRQLSKVCRPAGGRAARAQRLVDRALADRAAGAARASQTNPELPEEGSVRAHQRVCGARLPSELGRTRKLTGTGSPL